MIRPECCRDRHGDASGLVICPIGNVRYSPYHHVICAIEKISSNTCKHNRIFPLSLYRGETRITHRFINNRIRTVIAAVSRKESALMNGSSRIRRRKSNKKRPRISRHYPAVKNNICMKKKRTRARDSHWRNRHREVQRELQGGGLR